MEITRSTTIEEIVNMGASLVQFLSARGIRCIRCGEPIWGTLEEAARSKQFSDPEIEEMLTALNHLASGIQ